MNYLSRRAVLGGGLLVSLSPALAQDSSYAELPYVDVFHGVKGPGQPVSADIDAANAIANSMPRESHYLVMQRLASITRTGSTGERFNYRWKKIANPLIVRFFHDIGYSKLSYPNDCTPWCGATTAWCLKRAGHALPSDPASSQSYLHYGQKTSSPVPGDICVFTDVNDASHGHVGLFVSQTADSIRIIGGNQLGVDRTGCGPGFRASRIDYMVLPKNPHRDRKVDVHYFHAFVKPQFA